MAQRYGVRPSTLLRGDWDDLQLDYAVLIAAQAHQYTPESEKPPDPARRYLSVRHLARPQ